MNAMAKSKNPAELVLFGNPRRESYAALLRKALKWSDAKIAREMGSAFDKNRVREELRKLGKSSGNPAELVIFANPRKTAFTEEEKRELRRLHLKPSDYQTAEEVESVREMFREIDRINAKYRDKNPPENTLYDAIRHGDRVTIVDRFGQQRTGRAVMLGPAGWVLNMGGPHGTPAIAHPDNVTKVAPVRHNPSAEYIRQQLEIAEKEWRRAKQTLAEAKTATARRRADEDVQFWGNKMAFFSHANPGGETSEAEQAVKLYQDFHGKDPQGIVEAQRSAAMRLDYTALGPLLGLAPFVEGLKIPPPEHWNDGGYPVLEFGDVKLASNAEGTQLYAIGGDQDLTDTLKYFEDEEVDISKDLIDLRELAYVVYEARKSMDGFALTEYMHTFDEPRPRLGYDQVKREIFFIGGRYTVKAPGIEH